MVNITLVELHVEEGSISANLPFSGVTDGEDADSEDEETAEDEEAAASDSGSNRKKGLALLGVLVFLVVATAAVKYLTGEDEQPEVEIEAADEESPTVTPD